MFSACYIEPVLNHTMCVLSSLMESLVPMLKEY
jgi:hypothetical protein